MIRFLLAAVLASAAPLAQTVWTVGPSGANFTDLPAALAVATHGDMILVRPGVYTPGTTSQGVRVVGGTGRFLRTGSFVVRDLPATAAFSITGFQEADTQTRVALQVLRCTGPVLLQRLGGTPCIAFPSLVCSEFTVDVVDSRAVSLHESQLKGSIGLEVDGSTSSVTVTDSGIGATGAVHYIGNPGIELRGGTLWITGSRVAGADGSAQPTVPKDGGGNAIHALDGTVRVADSKLSGGLNYSFVSVWPSSAFLIEANAEAFVDPSVTYTYWTPSPGPIHSEPVPSISAPSVPIGGTVSTRWTGGLGQPALLAASLPGPPLATPWGELLLDPGTSVVLWAGLATPTPPTLTLSPAFVPGLMLTFQGAIALPTGLVLTNHQTLGVR